MRSDRNVREDLSGIINGTRSLHVWPGDWVVGSKSLCRCAVLGKGCSAAGVVLLCRLNALSLLDFTTLNGHQSSATRCQLVITHDRFHLPLLIALLFSVRPSSSSSSGPISTTLGQNTDLKNFISNVAATWAYINASTKGVAS